MSFLKKATSTLCSKKSEVMKDFSGKNKFIFDKFISLPIIKIFGVFNFKNSS